MANSTVEAIESRLALALLRVLPEATSSLVSDPDGGVTVRIQADETHVAEISRACIGGAWWWEVWQLYPELKSTASSQSGIDEFDAAAAAAIGVLAGAVALERMAVGAI